MQAHVAFVLCVTALCLAVLLGAPLLAFRTWRLPRRTRRRRSMLVPAAAAALLLYALARLGAIFGLDTSWHSFNLLLWLAAYVACCILTARSLSIPHPALRVPVTALACLPLLAGVLLGTVGIGTLLGCIDNNYPEATQTIRPGLVCEVRDWSWMGDNEGADYSLYRAEPGLPWLHRKVAEAPIALATAASPARGCALLAKNYKSARKLPV